MSDEPAHRGLRHWLGFVGSGTTSFVVDAGVLPLRPPFEPITYCEIEPPELIA